MDPITYLSGEKASQLLGVHKRTLYNWKKNGKITVLNARKINSQEEIIED